ncbi:MAG TPA: helix-turn-helix domain-containing protein [Pseudonocardia sp.]|nr:helix-turn-helix domain-containing protein [Pseudonocardia sp.]
MDDVESIGALAEPVRRALYEWVVGQAAPVSRDQAAAGAGVPRHTAKFHLDKLVADGLLETEFRRLTGRRGPGAGRPAKLYRRSPREVAVTLPPRRYELAARIMAAALDRGGSAEALAEAAAEVGRTANLEALGYEPHERDGVVELLNCPFHALAQEHTALVCGMNLHLVDALLEGSDRRAVLDPAPGRCCVTVVGDDSGRPPGSTPA